MSNQNAKHVDRYRPLFENMLNGFAYCRMIFEDGIPIDFIYVDVNKAFEELTGLRNAIGNKITEVIPGIRQSNPELFEIYGRVVVSGKPEHFETRIEGLKLWLNISVYCPEKEHVVAIFENVTKRKQAEEVLRNITEQWKETQVLGKIGSWEFDIKNQTITWSDETYVLYERDPKLGPPSPEEEARYYRPEQAKLLRDYAARAIETGREISCDLEAKLPSGKTIYFHSIMHPLKDAQGQVFKLSGIVQDLTERKQSEKALQESEEKYRSLVDNANEAILVAQDGMLKFVNRRTMEMTGYSKQELMTKPFSEFIHPDDRAMVIENHMKRIKGEPVPLRYTFMMLDSAGIAKWVEIGSAIIVWKGKPATLNFITDITDRKEAEEQIRMQLEELSHVTRVATMGELASSLAHEINQPLAAILSNAQAALRFIDAAEPNLEEVREALKDIINDDQLAGNVIKELRTLMKKEEPHWEPLDISRVIEEALVLTKSDSIIRNVKIKRDLPAYLPSVYGSRVQMQQVLINLINNGCEAMRETGPGERVLTIRAYTKGSENIVVEIIDCGHGLKEGTSEKIFKPFFTTKPKGLGMGLAISRSIIEAHDGSLTARNNPGKGATFSFTLPATGMKS